MRDVYCTFLLFCTSTTAVNRALLLHCIYFIFKLSLQIFTSRQMFEIPFFTSSLNIAVMLQKLDKQWPMQNVYRVMMTMHYAIWSAEPIKPTVEQECFTNDQVLSLNCVMLNWRLYYYSVYWLCDNKSNVRSSSPLIVPIKISNFY